MLPLSGVWPHCCGLFSRVGAAQVCGGCAACAPVLRPAPWLCSMPGPAEVNVRVSPAAWQGLGGENSVPRLFKALNAGLHTRSWGLGWARTCCSRGGRAAAFWRLRASLRFHRFALESGASWRQFPSLAHVPEGWIGPGRLAGSRRNLHAPKAAAAQSFVPRMLSRSAGLQRPAQEQRCWQPELCCRPGAVRGAQGARSCQFSLSLGLAAPSRERSWRL